MSKSCPICERGPRMGGKHKLLRGHYNPVKWERKQVNLQWAKLPAGGRVKICTRCLKKNLHLTAKIKTKTVTRKRPVKKAAAK